MADSAILQNDLRDMLRALGMPDHARPRSPHEVFRECIEKVERLRADLATYMGSTEETENRIIDAEFAAQELRAALEKISKRYPCDTAETMSRVATEALGNGQQSVPEK